MILAVLCLEIQDQGINILPIDHYQRARGKVQANKGGKKWGLGLFRSSCGTYFCSQLVVGRTWSLYYCFYCFAFVWMHMDFLFLFLLLSWYTGILFTFDWIVVVYLLGDTIVVQLMLSVMQNLYVRVLFFGMQKGLFFNLFQQAFNLFQ